MKLRFAALALLVTLGCLPVSFGGMLPGLDSLQERMRREDYFNRINRKIESDITATRVWKLRIEAGRFPILAIPVQDGSMFTVDETGTNEILFIVNEENNGRSSEFEVIPLAIRRTVRGGGAEAEGGITRSANEAQEVTSLVVHLKDFARLDVAAQRQIVDYIVDNTALATPELEIKPENKPSQNVSPFNRDFWSFAKATSHHMVPFLESGIIRKGRRPGAGLAVGSGTPVDAAAPMSTFNMRDSVVKDSMEIRVNPTWPAFDGVTSYRITVAESRDFSGPVIEGTSGDTSFTIASGLEYNKLYYCRIQDANVPSSPALKISMFTTRRRPESGAEIARAAAASDRLGYSLDFSMSRITFAHELLYSEKALGIPGFGFEVNFDNPILSLLPYKNPAMTWGGRLLLNTTGDKKDVLDRGFLELKLLAKTRFDARKFHDGMGALRYLFTPLVSSESPTLNVAAPGFAIEVATSRLWNLPYLNFYISTGSDEYKDPYASYGEGKNMYAYWSTSQWRGSMSFYFNLDSEPEFYLADALRKRLNIVRFDIGAGTYNVSRIGYDTLGNVASKTGVIKTSRIQPYLSVEYVHASQVKTGFGLRSAYFDNRVLLSFWLSLFKLGYHELRLEGTNILGPFGRARYEWETSGGTMLQFRYRLGF